MKDAMAKRIAADSAPQPSATPSLLPLPEVP
jgi:hypothetical protein